MTARPAASLRIHADLERLAEVRGFIRSQAPGLGADEHAVRDLVQAVDEWVTNVIVHGYRGEGGPIDIEIERHGQDVSARIRDAAPAFDPATVPAFDPAVPLEQRPFGKMGMALIRDLCSDFEHRALPEGGNEVTICRSAETVDREGGAA